MNALVWSPGFKRSFKRSIRCQPDLQDKIEDALELLAKDAFHCTVDFEYRIVFEFVQDLKTQEEMILLETVGTHDEVY